MTEKKYSIYNNQYSMKERNNYEQERLWYGCWDRRKYPMRDKIQE
jgi:hypothetical protein